MNNLDQGIGQLVSKILLDTMKGLVPGSEKSLRTLPAFRDLAAGKLDAAKELGSHLNAELAEAALKRRLNQFYGATAEVARGLVGAPFLCIYGKGSVEGGMITAAAAYGGQDGFELAAKEPGTISVWHSNRRGGYDVPCIAAHPAGGQGYVALWGVTVRQQELSMTDIVERFAFGRLTGENVADPNCQLRLGFRDPRARNVAADLCVRSMPMKGGDCLGSYELRSRRDASEGRPVY